MCGEFIDSSERPVNAAAMELDDLSSQRPNDPLVQLARQDLDPLSVEELTLRIAGLEAEIARSRKRMEVSVNHRSTADALFKR